MNGPGTEALRQWAGAVRRSPVEPPVFLRSTVKAESARIEQGERWFGVWTSGCARPLAVLTQSVENVEQARWTFGSAHERLTARFLWLFSRGAAERRRTRSKPSRT
jgi:hypothetical protein